MTSSHSKYFYNLTPEIILDTVERLGIRCTGKIMALNSLENRVYNVELDIADPSKLESTYDAYRVIKFYRPGRWTKEQILEEHQFIADLDERDIPVVCPLPFSDGSTLATLADFDSEGSNLFCAIFPRIGGRLLDELSDQQVGLIGRLVARLHQVGRSQKSRHRVSITPDTFGRQNLAYLKENNFLPTEIINRFSQLVLQICDTAEPWFEGVLYHRTHGDLHHGNILWANETMRLVDFDDFAMAPAIQDLWLLISGRDTWQKEQRELLIQSYSEIADFDFETVRLIEPLRALRMINFSAWIARRWEDPAFKNAFPGFGGPQYWREQLMALEECLQIMQCGEGY